MVSIFTRSKSVAFLEVLAFRMKLLLKGRVFFEGGDLFAFAGKAKASEGKGGSSARGETRTSGEKRARVCAHEILCFFPRAFLAPRGCLALFSCLAIA